MRDYLNHAQNLLDYTIALRRDFHQYPELGFQEFRTARIVAEELKNLGIPVKTGIAETGVMALIEGSHPGPVVLLRFDMDALPIQEEAGVVYASKNPGKMHACGHDGHTAVGLTVAQILYSHRDRLSGKIKLIFQPAEEGLGGAQRMISEGILENPKPDIALALHLWNEKPAGWLGIARGPVMAAAETFEISINGKGGHGAAPHLAIDPILAGSQIVVALQSIVARNVAPIETAVVSVTMFHGGDAFNIIPSRVSLQGTIRTFTPEVRSSVLKRFQSIVSGTAVAFGCEAVITLRQLTPAVVNNDRITERLQEVASLLLPENIIDRRTRTMTSEDMAFILQEIPGCFIFVGSANSDKHLNAAHHHPKFDFDEQVLSNAAALMSAAAEELLSNY